MSKQELRNAQNHLIGTVEKDSQGKQTLRDAKNHIKGFYDPKTNETRDVRNHLVGKGNLLTSLL